MSEKRNKAFVAARIATAPMVMSILLTSVMLAFGKTDLKNYLVSLACLAAAPLLAYLLTAAIPPLKRRGRSFERNLATLFSVVGYAAGFTVSFFTGGAAEKAVYLTYLISGVAIGVCTLAFHFKASGHSAGIAGPLTMLSFLVSPWFMCLVAVWILAFFSSLSLKRHTAAEFAAGGVIAAAATAFSLCVFGLL